MKSCKLIKSPSRRLDAAPLISGIRVDQNRRRTQEISKIALKDLGKKSAKVVEMLEDGKRRSIHQPIREVIESIRTRFAICHPDGKTRRQGIAESPPGVSDVPFISTGDGGRL